MVFHYKNIRPNTMFNMISSFQNEIHASTVPAVHVPFSPIVICFSNTRSPYYGLLVMPNFSIIYLIIYRSKTEPLKATSSSSSKSSLVDEVLADNLEAMYSNGLQVLLKRGHYIDALFAPLHTGHL